ncbi:GreA/GreB family elongation factor [Chloroflexota bacterium]
MGSIEQNLSLGEAVNHFLADLSPGERGLVQQEIYKFGRWFGLGRAFAGLTAAEVANYAERLSLSDTDYIRKLDLVRSFLVHAKKKGWSNNNLSTHLRARKGKTRLRSLPKQGSPETIFLTQQGYTDLEAELVALRSKSFELIDEIRRAAADKDFRENVPLQAAREQRGHLEGRITELEETLKSAAIIDKKGKVALRVSIGDSVILSDLDSGEELRYMLVNPREADPTGGKISSASPIGQAVIGKEQGETVKVTAPAGKLLYQIKQVER